MTTDLKSVSFQSMSAKSADQNNLPPLHEDNTSPSESVSVAGYIDVTTDAIARLYGGLYTLYQSFAPKMHLPEGKLLLGTAIQTQLIEPLSQSFPDFEEFSFTITDTGIIGNNEFTNTVINCMNTVMTTPVAELDGQQPEYLAALTPSTEDHEADWDID